MPVNVYLFNYLTELHVVLSRQVAPPLLICRVLFLQCLSIYSFSYLTKKRRASDHFAFGSSAMDKCISAGPLDGRPYDGTAALLFTKSILLTSSVLLVQNVLQ